ncbi:hypothetical protein GE09DRAFT_471006 [Coniochaeta sp. 2T2.1]|nr:hypothetical protein GE09DRAFT_471006 [Coniochaeta sp. 2T2.1]
MGRRRVVALPGLSNIYLMDRHEAKRGGKKSALQRKRDLKDEGLRQGILDRRNGSIASAKAGREWQKQFYQGVDIMELHGLGCGWYLLGGPYVASQYPSPTETKLEISGGTKGTGSGSIRLCGPRNYYGPGDWKDAIFLVPFAHIAQVIVLPTEADANGVDGDYRVIMVPTAATGLSPIKRHYPQIISFNWPRRPADNELRGKAGEVADREQDTYLSVFKRVVDEQIAPFKRKVTDLTEVEGPKEGYLQCPATLSFRREGSISVTGHIYLTHIGVLFLSDSARLYLPFNSFRKIYLVENDPSAEGQTGRPSGVDVYMPVIEPFYDKKRGKDSKLLNDDPTIVFKGMPSDMADELRQYGEKHKIEVLERGSMELTTISSSWKGLFPDPQLVDIEVVDHVAAMLQGK